MLTTLIKQRKESVESFTKGNRPELAEKESTSRSGSSRLICRRLRVRTRLVRWCRLRSPRLPRAERNRGQRDGLGDEGRAAADSGRQSACRWQTGQRISKGGAGKVGRDGARWKQYPRVKGPFVSMKGPGWISGGNASGGAEANAAALLSSNCVYLIALPKQSDIVLSKGDNLCASCSVR